jgi:Flp pilus assembly protein TadD
MNSPKQEISIAQVVYNQLQAQLSDDVATAIDQIERFASNHPDFAQAYNDLGVLYHRAGNSLFSLAHYEKANRLQPDSIVFRKNLADFYAVELGWVDDAILILVDLLKTAPNDVDILSSLAIISIKVNRLREAETFLGKILTLEPWNHDARRLLDDIRTGCYAIHPQPELTAQQDDSSLEALLQGLRQSIAGLSQVDQTTEERYLRAQQLAGQERAAEAIALLEELVRLEPTHALAWNDLGVLSYQAGDLNRSLAAHEQANRLEPKNPVFGNNLANLYYVALGRTDDAIMLFTRLLRENPDNIETLLALGQISVAIGCNEQARIFVAKVLELEPWNVAARNMLENV